MEKTIIINIGNTIIHIEENAYELLKVYLAEVKQYFTNHADDLEIVADIENRIAELISEQLQEQKKQVLDTPTVNLIIKQMGRVQDFESVEENEDEPVTQREQNFYSEKKLYRDMDDRVVAGVCSGIAHFVNIDARWIRLAFILMVLVGGFGLLLYAILWVIMPKATSRIEKMEMKGEPANLQGFQNNLNEELQGIKEKFKEVNQHAKPLLTRFGIFIGEFFEWLGRFISGTGKIIFKVIAGFIILFGCLFLISLIIGAGSIIGIYDDSVYNAMPFAVINEEFRVPVLFTGFVVLFVPILALVLFSIRVAFNKQAINKVLSFALLIIWLTGVAFAAYYTSKTLTEFKQHAELTQSVDLKTSATYVLNVDKSRFFSKEDSLNYQIKLGSFKNNMVVDGLSDDGPFVDDLKVGIYIEKSIDGKTTLTQTHRSQGKTFKVALQNAQNINYKYTINDSVLNFNQRFQIGKGDNWRDQSVKLILAIPVGTKLILKSDSYRYIHNFYAWSCDDHGDENSSIFIMTEDGLKCKYELDHPEENKDKE